MTTSASPYRRLTERLADEARQKISMRGQQRGGRRPLDQEIQDQVKSIRPDLKLDVERARFVTQGYRESETDEPVITRRARALANFLENITLYIGEHDRIVGNAAAHPDYATSYPEIYSSWLDKAIDTGFKEALTDEEKAEMHSIDKYWQSRSVQKQERFAPVKEDKQYWPYFNEGVFAWVHGYPGGQMPNYEKLFKVGLSGIIREARDKLQQIESDRQLMRDYPKDFLKKRTFLEAAITALEAGSRWVKRYSFLAKSMADGEKDDSKRRQLEQIAETCDWVSENPPRTFYEALQLWYFVFLINRVIDLPTAGMGDRFDYIFCPFYRKDREQGKTTSAEARELLEHVWIKLTELPDLNPPMAASASKASLRCVTIGGQDSLGRDITNELTYLIMDSVKSLKLTEPMICVRLHRNTPDEFLYRLADTLREDAGHYGIFNDEFAIPYLMSKRIPTEDARNWAVEDSLRQIVVGKPMSHRATSGTGFALPKCLEYALNQGRDYKFFGGRQVGVATGDPLNFNSIYDVVQAYLEQVKFFTDKFVTLSNMTDAIAEYWLPQPFNSALVDGCIESATDVKELHYWHKTNIQPVGHTNVVDALVAMRKLIFEDRKVTMAQLLLALRDNWKGHEELRQLVLSAPKFGNNDDYVDLFAREVHIKTAETMQSFKTIYEHSVTCDGSGGISYYTLSGLTGATPDGRKDGDLFDDGTTSPAPGSDKKGAIAVLKSAAKVDPLMTFNHLLSQRWLPESFDGTNKFRFIAYLKIFIDLGLPYVEGNVVDDYVLLEAQRHPENYRDLIVRTAGSSAYFVDLEKPLQDQLIARTKHEMSQLKMDPSCWEPPK